MPEKEFNTKPNPTTPEKLISFIVNRQRKSELIDIDAFISEQKLSKENFYLEYISELLGNKGLCHKVEDGLFRYKFQETLEQVSLKGHSFIRELAMNYLVGGGFLLPFFSDREFNTICDILYRLNKSSFSGNTDKKKEIIRHLISHKKEEYIACCIYLLDKKLKLGPIEDEIEGKFSKTKRDNEFVWRRTNFPKGEKFIIIEDGDGYYYSRIIER